ncbi:MAG: sigma-70 family RNA polymerase sigma factor [Bacteroidota bacterium]
MNILIAEKIEEAVQQHEAELTAFLRARVANKVVAEDLLQEVWYQLSRQVEKEQPKHLRAWLFQVARNRVIDHYRKKAPDWLEDYLFEEEDQTNQQWLTDHFTPEEYYWQEQFWEAFYEAVDALPQKQRWVFLQNELEGITLRELAEQSNEKLKTIISRKGYAVRRLRDLLEDWYEDINGI